MQNGVFEIITSIVIYLKSIYIIVVIYIVLYNYFWVDEKSDVE